MSEKKQSLCKAPEEATPAWPRKALFRACWFVHTIRLFHIWADELDRAVATQPARSPQGWEGVFMGLAANDLPFMEHVWSSWSGQLRQDINKAWVCRPAARTGFPQQLLG